jgi:hypothetical protein
MVFLKFLAGLAMVLIFILTMLGLGWIGEKTIFEKENDYLSRFFKGWYFLVLIILLSAVIVLMYGIGELIIGFIF